jgi:isochorismate hydrolase
MSNIVARLHDMQQYGINLTDPQRTLSGQAADEIKRLQTHLVHRDKEIARLEGLVVFVNAEIEQLRAALKRIANDDVDMDLKGRADILGGIAYAALEK